MTGIGFSKFDNEKRLFEYDDRTLIMSCPPKAKVRYLDNNEIGYLILSCIEECSPKDLEKHIFNLIKLKHFCDEDTCRIHSREL